MKRLLNATLGALIGVISLCSSLSADDLSYLPITPYGTLNNTDNSLIIPNTKAQDLLNVNIAPGGASVKKRDGYDIVYALSVPTSPVHGVHYFYDSGGNDVALFFNDNRVSASIGGASVATVTVVSAVGATWQCVDSQGFAYCANTSRTQILKTNGSTTSNLTGFTSTGTLVAVTPERLVQSGFSASPNDIAFSKASDFATWTVGSNPTDPITFTVSAPGPKITHITYAFDRLMWFKSTSFGYILIGNQVAFSDWQVVTVDPNVGTFDNTSVYREGILYFRGQDGHLYRYDGANLSKITRDIQGTIGQSQSRVANSWTQTTAADFNAGFIDVDIDSTTVSNSLLAKTTTQIYTSSTSWASGTVTEGNSLYVDTITANGFLQTTFPDNFTSYRNGTSGTKQVWNTFGTPTGVTSDGTQLTISADGGDASGIVTSSLLSNYAIGTTYYYKINSMQTHGGGGSGRHLTFALNTATTNVNPDLTGTFWRVRISSQSNGVFISIVNSNGIIITSSFTAPTFPVDVFFNISTTTYRIQAGTITFSGTHAWPNNPVYGFLVIPTVSGTLTKLESFAVAPQTFTYQSTSFDTGISTPIWSVFHDSSTGNGTLSYNSQVSSDNSSFDSAVAVSSGNLITSARKRFIKMNAVFNQTLSTGNATAVSVDFFDLSAGSSGTFRSAVKNAPSLTTWDTFDVSRVDNGGSQSFFIRSSTNPITVNSSTPSWTSISPGAVPTISTGTYFQFRDDFLVTTGSHTQRLDSFIQNWFEGAATDKSYATYFKDAIWWSIASGAGATANNKILYYDMINDGMTLYDLPSNGFYVRNELLNFGSVSSGNIFRYGNIDNDNGAAINAYWKSKDFVMQAPFQDKEAATISFVAKAVSNSSMTVTYTLNGSTSTSYTVPFQSADTFIKSNKNLPGGKTGQTLNIQFGNNAADQPFEIFGTQVGYRTKTWKPE